MNDYLLYEAPHWVLYLIYLGMFIVYKFLTGGFSLRSSRSGSSRKRYTEKPYLDKSSAITHGMSLEEVVAYNSGDQQVRDKYREKAIFIDKTDEF